MRRAQFAALMVLAGLSAPAIADDWQDCKQSDADKAIAACTQIIGKGPEGDKQLVVAYTYRGIAYAAKGDNDRAIADYTKAIEIDPKYVLAHTNRGNRFTAKGNHDAAITDYSKVIELDPKNAGAYSNRGKAHEAKGNRDAAIADYEKLIALLATSATDQQRQEVARERIARLKQAVLSPPPSTAPRRVALVIGNSNYSNAGVLPNPVNDARAIAATLSRLGFAVTDYYDVTREKMGRALKDFGDRAEGAEWAVVFFAGHGLEINGTTYLVPIDAELKRDSHVADEAMSLTQVQGKVDAASKLGLVILDSCRNNPFVSRMVRIGGASRSLGRGLSPIEPEGNVLVAYAAKHGTTADDGSGKHSPFTEALLSNIEEPGLEINFFFRKVRDQVWEKTAKQQEPFLYGSLSSEPLYFKTSTTR
jgi:tetratricopeptide (TPR) repeat protein